MSRKEANARFIAEKHYEFGSHIKHIFRINSPEENENPGDPIRLLQVNELTIPIGIMPLRFAAIPSLGIDYPIVIVEVTEDEYSNIRSKTLLLPHDWSLGEEILRGVGT